MEEQMNHVSHKQHPLNLIATTNMRKRIVCGWCEETISNGNGSAAAYACIDCHYFLHKTCAQLQVEPTIHHYLHPQHAMVFYDDDGSLDWFCDVCGDDKQMRFRYRCSSCDWDCCTKCAVAVAAFKDELVHEGHPQHTLALRLIKPAVFTCDACRTDDKDLFYQCNDCPFSVHKTCATELAPQIHLPHHHPDHPLLLAYELPDRFLNYQYDCEFCSERILQSYWVYHCPNCRYFAHIKCALNATSNCMWFSEGTQVETNDDDDGDDDDDDLVHFPMSEALTEPLKLLEHNKETSNDDGAGAAMEKVIIDHWSHPHPLTLFDGNVLEPQGIVDSNLIVVCHGCVRPLSLPYYLCNSHECRFFLHKYCAELPRTIMHKLHPKHSFYLINFQQALQYAQTFTIAYRCSGCSVYGNSFVYRCDSCKFYLDVNCAFLPNTIKHESHDHPLTQNRIQDIGRDCEACGFMCHRWISYSCNVDNCCFDLDNRCALKAPSSRAHRYCKGHRVPLRYPPIDHLADFYCDICEEEIHPKLWMYHCDKCDNSFHIHCLEQRDRFGNCNFQGTLTVPYHKHPLTYARRKTTPQYVCLGCNKDINGHLILACRTGTCPFRVCRPCHQKGAGLRRYVNYKLYSEL